MRILLRCALLAGLLSLPVSAGGPEGRFFFRTFGDEEGFTSRVGEVLFQDATGFLWVGTPDGLFRYDGQAFTRFGKGDGLPSERITAIHQRPDGRLYVGTRSGLARWDGLAFVPLGKAAGLVEAPIVAMASDRETLVVGTSKGLYLSISEIFHVEPRGDGKPEGPITALAVPQPGSLYLARDGQLLLRESGKTTDYGTARDLPAGTRIDALLVDGEKRLWARTLGALYTLPPGGARLVRDDTRLPPALGWGRLAVDAAGRILVPTAQGVAFKSEGAWRVVGPGKGLPSDVAFAALVDREGSLWVGLARTGLAQRPGSGAFTYLSEEDGLPGGAVWSIARDPGGALWVGAQDGLVRLGEGGTRVYRERDGLAGDAVLAVAAAADGTVWAGSVPGGVTRIGADGKAQRFTAEGLSGPEFQVLALRLVGQDVWAGATTGVYRLAAGKGKFTRVLVPGADDADTVYAFAEDDAGALYAVGRAGLQRLTGGAPARFRKRNGLKADSIVSAAFADGSLVVAYREGQGLERVTIEGDRLMLSPFTPQEVPPPRRPAFVGRDIGGSIWVGGSGIDVYPKGVKVPIRLGKSDGLVSEDASLNAFLAERDGTVWLGTSRGLVRFAPGFRLGARPSARVAFTGVSFGSRRVSPNDDAVLAAHERTMRLTWSGLSFADAGRLRFRYRLLPLDDAPTDTSIPELTLKGLQPGKYRLEVAAISPSGSPGSPTTYAFEVEPAWWQSFGGRAALGAASLAVAAAVFAWRTKGIRGEVRTLQDELERRGAEIRMLEREKEEAGLTDPLTGIRNRRFLQAMIGSEAERSIRAFAPLSTPAERRLGELVFYLIEIRGIEAVNARHGFEAGDRVLVEAVQSLKSVVRSSDFLIRWGGSTLLILTRSSGRDQAQTVAGRLLDALESVPPTNQQWAECSFSIGWAPFPWFVDAPAEVSFEDVVLYADRALQVARGNARSGAVGALAPGPKKGATGSGDAAIEALDGVPAVLVRTFPEV